MADYDLKSITPKASVAADTEYLFGAADQSSGTPIPYAFSIIKTWIKSWIVKGDVGLGNVDNTSDATKNAAAVTLTNKTLTSPVINTPTGIVKGDVGLGNVSNNAQLTIANNLSDLNNATTARTNLGLATTGASQLPFYGDANIGLGPLAMGSATTLTITNQRLMLVPFIVPETKTFVGYSINVVTREAAKGIRIGIWNANQTTRQPTTLVLDAGIVDLDTGTGVLNRNTKTISQALTPGLYFAGFLSNGTGTAAISGIGTNISVPSLGVSLTSGGTISYIAGYNLAGQTYQAFATALSDLSGQTMSPTNASIPIFTLN